MNKYEISINGRSIGDAYPPYIVAELSGNHNGDINRAFELIDEAKRAGVDAIKLQTYTPDTLTLDHDGPGFVLSEGAWEGRKLYELLGEAMTPWEWHEELFAKARDVGLTIFSTPFDPTSVDFLERLDPPIYKIASFEIVDIPLIEMVAGTGKPIIMSTGMANADEIQDAVSAARGAGCKDLVLLHCISGYPTRPEECNLRTIPDLAQKYDVIAGLSDHSLEASIPVAATVMGAALIEKHFTMRRSDGGPDASFSLEPQEMTQLVHDCRTAYAALGTVNYDIAPSEAKYVKMRRSLYIVDDVKVGEAFTENNVRSIRPGFGLAPKHYQAVLGRTAKVDLKRGTPLSEEYFA
jgi:N-acetylneuraminate synthase